MTVADDLPRNRRTGAFERRVAKALEAALSEDERVVVAASGGPDSTAALVAAVRSLGPARVTAAHFDHRLRSVAEAAAERAAVEAVARRLGVASVAGRASRRPDDTSEDAAREARYRWLASAARRVGVAACVTGHTRDDQAETVLLRLVRGAAAGGAAGMAPAAPWPVPVRGGSALRVLRPLLGVTRVEVEAYLDALGLEAVLDASNVSPRYARNRIRREVMPVLREVNARAGEHLARFAELQRDDDAVLMAHADAWLRANASLGASVVEIDRAGLRALHPAVARRVIALAMLRLGCTLTSTNIEDILGSTGRRGARVDLPLARSETAGTILRLRLRPPRPAVD